MKNTLIKSITILLIIFSLFATNCYAENAFKNVIFTGLWGGAIGALAGTATLAFHDEPKEHTSDIVKGAAIGILVGMGYGFYKEGKKGSLISYNSKQKNFSMQVPKLSIYKSNRQKNYSFNLPLFESSF